MTVLVATPAISLLTDFTQCAWIEGRPDPCPKAPKKLAIVIKRSVSLIPIKNIHIPVQRNAGIRI